MYWWNTKIVKEKQLPIYSTLLGVATFHVINFSTVIFCFFLFVVKDVKAYPKWLHILCMVLIVCIDYLYFIHGNRYKKIIANDQSLQNLRRNDFYIILYMILSIVAVILIIIEARKSIL